MIWTCVQIELKHERIGCHWSPLQSSKPPSTNALPIAQSSRIQCNIMHCSSNPPAGTSKCTQRRLPTVPGNGVGVRVITDLIVLLLYERYISSTKQPTFWQDKTWHDRVEFFRLHLLFLPTPRILCKADVVALNESFANAILLLEDGIKLEWIKWFLFMVHSKGSFWTLWVWNICFQVA